MDIDNFDPKAYIKPYREILEMEQKKEITPIISRNLIRTMVTAAGTFDKISPKEYVKKEGLVTVSDTGAISKLCSEVIKENPAVVEEFKSGNEKSFNYLMGQVMKKTKGQATPKEVNETLRKMIK